MGKMKRVWKILSGMLVISFAVSMMLDTEDAFILVSFMVAFLMLEKGIRHIFYYATMAHHMVGGKVILFYGVLMFDLGVFAVSISTQATAIIIIYLIAVHMFTGGVSAVRAIRNKKEGYPRWKSDLALGMIHILLAICCIIFRGSQDVLVYVYCIGLINLTVLDIGSAFKKSAIVYIQ